MTAPIRKSIDALMREVALLKEYRERLIVQTVFGVADVRRLAAALPNSGALIETIPNFGEDDASIGEETAA